MSEDADLDAAQLFASYLVYERVRAAGLHAGRFAHVLRRTSAELCLAELGHPWDRHSSVVLMASDEHLKSYEFVNATVASDLKQLRDELKANPTGEVARIYRLKLLQLTVAIPEVESSPGYAGLIEQLSENPKETQHNRHFWANFVPASIVLLMTALALSMSGAFGAQGTIGSISSHTAAAAILLFIVELLAAAIASFAEGGIFRITRRIWRYTPISRVVCELGRLVMPSPSATHRVGYGYLSPPERISFDERNAQIDLSMRMVLAFVITDLIATLIVALSGAWELGTYLIIGWGIGISSYCLLWLQVRDLVNETARAMRTRMRDLRAAG